MKIRKSLLIGVLSVAALTSCGGGQSSTYKLTFHQDEGNKNDVFTVTKGKTTAAEAKEFQDKITINPRKGYDTAWEPYDFSTITSDYTVNMSYTAHEYTITYKNDETVVGTTKYNVNSKDVDIKAKEPKDFEKTGLDYTWENYTIEGKAEDIVVKASKVTEHEFTITYLDGDNILGFTKYTIKSTDEEVKAEEPEIPAAESGHTKAYEEYTVVGKKKDFSVNVIDTLNTYYATFVDKDDKQVGDKVPFTIETKEIEEPDVPSREHYTGEWEDYQLGAADITIHPVYTAITYHATFKDGETTEATLDFSAESTSITAPAISSEAHYTSIKWSDGTNEYDGGATIDMSSSLQDTTFNKVRVGEKHTITINENGGTLPTNAETTVEVEYGKTYTLPTPTFKSGVATFMGWFDSSTGKQVATTGTSAFTADATVIARYKGDLETEKGKDVVIDGTRHCVDTKTLVTTTKTEGNNSLEIVTKASPSFSCSFDADFVTSAFTDTNVTAIAFDCKTEVECTKLSYANLVNTLYEEKTDSGFGAQTTWKTFLLTREIYEKEAKLSQGRVGYVVTVGDQLPVGKKIWFDNIRPISESLNEFDFSYGRLVPVSAGYYNHTASFRDLGNSQIFLINTNNEDPVAYGFDDTVKTTSTRSIKYHRYPLMNIYEKDSAVIDAETFATQKAIHDLYTKSDSQNPTIAESYTAGTDYFYKNGTKQPWTNINVMKSNVKSVSFDIRLSIDYNLNTVRDGKGGALLPEGKIIKANTWTSFTVTSDRMNGNTFCGFNGSPEFDFWIDNVRVTYNV